jgi:hypothetical protein
VSVRSWLTPTLLVATLVLAGCGAGDGLRVEDGHEPAAGQATTSPAPPTETPTQSKSSNGIMRDSETPHIDGERSGSGPAALSVRELRALLLTDSAVDADVIGTGVPQRIVTVKVLNTGWTFVAYLVGDVGGLPKVRSTIRGQDMRITAGKNGSLVVGSKVYGPTDRSCCPSGSKVEVYRWNGNYLVKKSEVFTKGS